MIIGGVMPAKAGIHIHRPNKYGTTGIMGPRFCGDDET